MFNWKWDDYKYVTENTKLVDYFLYCVWGMCPTFAGYGMVDG